jgi:hypothetical protein
MTDEDTYFQLLEESTRAMAKEMKKRAGAQESGA